MRKILIGTIICSVILTGICIPQTKKLNWGISAPILSTSDSKELAVSRILNDSYMILFWGDFYYDKNIDITPNQDLFENFSYGIETELRRNFSKNNKIIPYIGLALRYGYSREENRYIYPYSSNNEFNIENTESKQIGSAFSFGAEYFITPTISIFAHTRLFNIYYSWNHDYKDYINNNYDKDNKYDSVKTKGFERSTLYVRFYF